jgi:hypothetical protein
MAGQRHRPIWIAAIALILVWLLSWGGYVIAGKTKITPDMVRAYASTLDLSKLSAADRARALRELAEKYNALTFEEHRGLRPDTNLFAQMTEEEKASFVEATMPTEIKLALNAFDQMPEDRRQRLIDNALQNLRAHADDPNGGPNGPAGFSPEEEAKIRSLGLKTFYGESSAETKAELAPLLNELQNQIQNGRGPH